MDNTSFPNRTQKATGGGLLASYAENRAKNLRSPRLVSLRLGRRLERIQTRAATVGLVEGGAEMAQAAVTDFQRSLGHVAFAGAQQLRGALHANLTKIL